MKTLKELLELRAALETRMQALVDKADLTDEEQKQLEDGIAEGHSLDEQIEQRKAVDARNVEQRNAAAEWLQSRRGTTQTETRRSVPDTEMNRRNRRDPVDNPLSWSPENPNGFSVCRALLSVLEGRSLDGYESEVTQEIRHRYPTPAGVRSREALFSIPWHLPVNYRSAQVMYSRLGSVEQRALNLSAGAGGVWGQYETSMIELLRAKSGVMALGPTVFTGVTGNKLVIPKQTAGNTGYWLAEAGSPTASNATVGNIEITPKTAGAYTDLTRALLQQQSLDFESFARAEIVTTLAITMDDATWNGTGSNNQPTGILNDSSIATVELGDDGAAPTYPKMVALEAEVQNNNYDSTSFYYVGNSKVSAKLKTTLIGTNTAAIYLLRDGQVNDTPFRKTNLLPSNLEKGEGADLSAMVYGDFSQIIMAMWGQMDVIFDPYALSTSGGRRIVVLQDMGIKARQPKALAKIVDMVTTL